MSCCCVHGRRVFSNPVTYVHSVTLREVDVIDIYYTKHPNRTHRQIEDTTTVVHVTLTLICASLSAVTSFSLFSKAW